MGKHSKLFELQRVYIKPLKIIFIGLIPFLTILLNPHNLNTVKKRALENDFFKVRIKNYNPKYIRIYS